MSKTLLSRILFYYIKQGGKRLTTRADIRTLLNALEEADILNKSIRTQRNKELKERENESNKRKE